MAVSVCCRCSPSPLAYPKSITVQGLTPSELRILSDGPEFSAAAKFMVTAHLSPPKRMVSAKAGCIWPKLNTMLACPLLPFATASPTSTCGEASVESKVMILFWARRIEPVDTVDSVHREFPPAGVQRTGVERASALSQIQRWHCDRQRWQQHCYAPPIYHAEPRSVAACCHSLELPPATTWRSQRSH